MILLKTRLSAIVFTVAVFVFGAPAAAFASITQHHDASPSPSPVLAETGVEFMPMLIAAAVVLVVIGTAVVAAQLRVARLDR